MSDDTPYTIYLAGPMRGYEDFNFPAFDAAAAWLRDFGWVVLSPADRDRDHGFDETANTMEGFDLEAAMRHDLTWVIEADGIVLLPGWEESTGARIERLVAETCGKQTWLWAGVGNGAAVMDHRVMMKAVIDQ